jgi:plastocyanin domain-containing protein
MKTLISIIAALALVAGLAPAEEKAERKRFVATIGEDGYQHVEMTGGGYYFDPSIVVVKVNVPVELTIRKEPGITPHNFSMHSPEAGLEFSISLSTEPQKVSFMATKTGSFPFECTKKMPFVKSHKDRGMHGVLEVVE